MTSTTHELWASPQSIIEKGGVDPKMMEELRALLLKREDIPANTRKPTDEEAR